MPMYADIPNSLNTLFAMEPFAYASIAGSRFFPAIKGIALLYPICSGTLFALHAIGLPYTNDPCSKSFYGLHIHEGTKCNGNETDAFANAGGHYNPGNCTHPNHSGDLPPLLGNNGEALSIFYTDSFLPSQLLGRTIIIHDMPDDFKTQPSGASGMKIACGEICNCTLFDPLSTKTAASR